jgi:hypothetical protein
MNNSIKEVAAMIHRALTIPVMMADTYTHMSPGILLIWPDVFRAGARPCADLMRDILAALKVEWKEGTNCITMAPKISGSNAVLTTPLLLSRHYLIKLYVKMAAILNKYYLSIGDSTNSVSAMNIVPVDKVQELKGQCRTGFLGLKKFRIIIRPLPLSSADVGPKLLLRPLSFAYKTMRAEHVGYAAVRRPEYPLVLRDNMMPSPRSGLDISFNCLDIWPESMPRAVRQLEAILKCRSDESVSSSRRSIAALDFVAFLAAMSRPRQNDEFDIGEWCMSALGRLNKVYVATSRVFQGRLPLLFESGMCRCTSCGCIIRGNCLVEFEIDISFAVKLSGAGGQALKLAGYEIYNMYCVFGRTCVDAATNSNKITYCFEMPEQFGNVYDIVDDVAWATVPLDNKYLDASAEYMLRSKVFVDNGRHAVMRSTMRSFIETVARSILGPSRRITLSFGTDSIVYGGLKLSGDHLFYDRGRDAIWLVNYGLRHEDIAELIMTDRAILGARVLGAYRDLQDKRFGPGTTVLLIAN